jgi:hypothetical protein
MDLGAHPTGSIPGSAEPIGHVLHRSGVTRAPSDIAHDRPYRHGQGAPEGLDPRPGLKGYQYAETFTQRMIVAESG